MDNVTVDLVVRESDAAARVLLVARATDASTQTDAILPPPLMTSSFRHRPSAAAASNDV